MKVERLVVNRVITIQTNNLPALDTKTSKLLDIIDAYGGTNPFPRFFVTEGYYYYSCTTKIQKKDTEEFDKEVKELDI